MTLYQRKLSLILTALTLTSLSFQMLHVLAFLVFGVIVLKTDRSDCPCGKPLVKKQRNAGDGEGTCISLYTRDGVVQARHHEYRCRGASRPESDKCRAGHYYGYHTTDKGLHYNEDALSREYLITSRRTG